MKAIKNIFNVDNAWNNFYAKDIMYANSEEDLNTINR